jgi:broad specificity phosphatase PhoE
MIWDELRKSYNKSFRPLTFHTSSNEFGGTPPSVEFDNGELNQYENDDPLKWRTLFAQDPFEEPYEVFTPRVARFKACLAARDENTIAVVAHHDFIQELTGVSLYLPCGELHDNNNIFAPLMGHFQ